MSRRRRKSARPAETPSASSTPSPEPILRAPPGVLDYGLWITLTAAALTHLGHWVSVRSLDPLYAQTLPGHDMHTYWEWAKAIAGGDWVGEKGAGAPFYNNPLYPYFLAVLFRPFGQSFEAVHIIQALIGLLPPVLLYSLCRRLFGRGPAALATGLMTALYAPLLFYEQVLLTEGLLFAIHAGILWSLVRGQDAPPRRAGVWALAAGVLSGAACWGRGNFLLVIPILAAAWLFVSRLGTERSNGETPADPSQPARPAPDRGTWLARGATCAATFVLGAALMLSLTLWRNHYVSGRWVFTTTNAPTNFYIGNCSESPGMYHQPGRLRLALKAKYGSYGAVPWIRELWYDISARPKRFLGLLLRKTWMFWNSYDVPDNVNFYAGKRYSWLVRFSPLTWLTVLPLAVIGIVETRRLWRKQVFLYIYTAGFTASIIVVFIAGRFRLPVAIPLLVWAGVAAANLLACVRERQWRSAALRGAVLAAGVAVLWPGWSPVARAKNPRGGQVVRLINPFDYEAIYVAHRTIGQQSKALDALEEAVARYPWYEPLVGSLGNEYVRAGKPEKALELIRELLRYDPKNERALRSLKNLENWQRSQRGRRTQSNEK